jgi:hypothetical protein
MDYVAGMQVFQAMAYTVHKGLDFRNCEGISCSKEIVDGAKFTEFQIDIDIIIIFKMIIQFDRILIMQ